MSETLETLEELCALVTAALSVDYGGAPNERVRDVPDLRTVRYYATLGLVDRPTRMRGRTALYGRRHLLQLVAIKRLQADGLTLHDIQQRMLGLSDREFEPIARLPKLPERPEGGPVPEAPRRRDFWKSVPEPVGDDPEASSAPTVVQGVPLNDRVVLLLPLRRSPDAADLEAIRVAAEPLFHLLERRRLIG